MIAGIWGLGLGWALAHAPYTTVIQNVRVWDAPATVTEVSVAVGRVAGWDETGLAVTRIPPGATLIDGRGGLLMPGFVVHRTWLGLGVYLQAYGTPMGSVAGATDLRDAVAGMAVGEMRRTAAGYGAIPKVLDELTEAEISGALGVGPVRQGVVILAGDLSVALANRRALDRLGLGSTRAGHAAGVERGAQGGLTGRLRGEAVLRLVGAMLSAERRGFDPLREGMRGEVGRLARGGVTRLFDIAPALATWLDWRELGEEPPLRLFAMGLHPFTAGAFLGSLAVRGEERINLVGNTRWAPGGQPRVTADLRPMLCGEVGDAAFGPGHQAVARPPLPMDELNRLVGASPGCDNWRGVLRALTRMPGPAEANEAFGALRPGQAADGVLVVHDEAAGACGVTSPGMREAGLPCPPWKVAWTMVGARFAVAP